MEKQKRIALKQFRVGHDLTQHEMAAKIGVNPCQYQNAEGGQRDVRIDFWQKLQKAFDIPDAEMWRLMQKGAKQ